MNNNYIYTPAAYKHIEYVNDNFLSKPYNPDYKKYDASDWVLTTPNGKINRPNHGLAHTLRVAAIIPVINEFMKEFSPYKNEFNKLTEKDLIKAQYTMLFSVIGRENEIGWTSALNLFKKGETKTFIYEDFKNKAKKAFNEYSKKNAMNIFEAESELAYYTECLDTGKPGIKGALGILMQTAHELDLIRCYKYSLVKEKRDKIAKLLGGNKDAADKLMQYTKDLITATGDRIIGDIYEHKYKPHNKELFYKCSTDPKFCLQKIQEVAVPSPKVKEQIKKDTEEDKKVDIKKLSKVKNPILSKFPKQQSDNQEKIKSVSSDTLQELDQSNKEIGKKMLEQSKYLSKNNKNKLNNAVKDQPKIPNDKDLKHLSAQETAEKTVDSITKSNDYLDKLDNTVNEIKKSDPNAPLDSNPIQAAKKKNNSILKRFYDFCKKIPILSSIVKKIDSYISKNKIAKKH